MSLYSSYTERGQHDETIRLLALAAKQHGAEDEELALQVAEEAANNKASLRRIGAASLMALSTMALVANIASIAKVPQVHRNSDRTTRIDQSSKVMTRLASFLGELAFSRFQVSKSQVLVIVLVQLGLEFLEVPSWPEAPGANSVAQSQSQANPKLAQSRLKSI